MSEKVRAKPNWGGEVFAFTRNVAAFVAASGIIWAAGQQIFGPAVSAAASEWMQDAVQPLKERVEQNTAAIEADRKSREEAAVMSANLRSAIASIAETQATMAETLDGAVTRLSELDQARRVSAEPVMRFSANRFDHSIEDGAPDDIVEVTWTYYKMRDDCGRPAPELFFRNGGNRIHRFREASAIDANGRGVGFAAAPGERQTITYTVRIPGDEGVQPGNGYGWNQVSYPDCPNVKPVRSPEVFFKILPRSR